jgi:uncharacterized C2H2 Zn-finger protein
MRTHNCQWCDQTFVRLTEYQAHFVKVHLHNPNTDMRRTVSCWACAGQIHLDMTHCPHCGWERTEMHIKGTQHTNKEEQK